MFARQCDLYQVIRMIFEMNSCLMRLNNYQSSNLIREVKAQQKRIQRKRDILARNYLPSPCVFPLSCCKASKRKAFPFCDETPPKVRRCNYDECAIIYRGSDGNRLPVLTGMLETC